MDQYHNVVCLRLHISTFPCVPWSFSQLLIEIRCRLCPIILLDNSEFEAYWLLTWLILQKARNKLSVLFRLPYTFYIHGSVHRNSILIRYNKMQQYAGIYLLQNNSICFGCPSQHPSSGVHKNVTAASGTGHSIWATTFLQLGKIWPRWSKVVAQVLWPVPEAAVTVLRTPYDGCCEGHPKHVEWFCK